jgi:hypothetical protein
LEMERERRGEFGDRDSDEKRAGRDCKDGRAHRARRAGRVGTDGRRHGEERDVSEFLQYRERVKRESDGG